MFCLSTNRDTQKSFLTVVQIRKFDNPFIDNPQFFYYTQDYDANKIDFQYPVRFVSNFTNVT